MKLKKVVLSGVCAAALVVGTVAGTMAYLTSSTEVVTNTFTVGSITATLDETDVDLYGVKDGETRVTQNEYKLIPGHTYVKDPIVHIQSGSEPCWLFVKVVNPYTGVEADSTIANQMNANGWVETSTAGVYVWGVNGVATKIDASAAAVDKPVFEKLNIKANASLSDLGDITVVACAVQADGLTADAALAQAVFA